MLMDGGKKLMNIFHKIKKLKYYQVFLLIIIIIVIESLRYSPPNQSNTLK